MQRLCTRSLYEISVTSSLEEFSWQDLCTDLHALSLCKVKVCRRGVLARSLYKSCIRGLLVRLWKRSVYARLPQKISVRDLCSSSFARSLRKIAALFTRSPYKTSDKRSPDRISVQDLYESSVGKISVRGLLARSLYKLPIRGLLAKFLHEMSRFVRGCAVEMHMDISQEPFCLEIYREKAGR